MARERRREGGLEGVRGGGGTGPGRPVSRVQAMAPRGPQPAPPAAGAGDSFAQGPLRGQSRLDCSWSKLGVVAGNWGPGEVFPLPAAPSEGPPREGLSRGVVQRVQARRRLDGVVNEAVSALNWAAGTTDLAPACLATPVHQQIHSDLRGLVRRYEGVQELKPSEAARAFLRHKAGYADSASGVVKPFVQSQVSLPARSRDAPLAREVLSEPVRSQLEGLLRAELYSSDELAAGPGEVDAYWDPVLRGGGKA